MTGRTVSAYADEATAARIAELAKLEDRSPAQIAAAALRLYVGLPEVAHRALRRLEATESPELIREAQRAITRKVLDVLFDDAERYIVESMRRKGIGNNIGDSEDEILTEAVRLTTQLQ
jgi:predicted transcriptional regulator